MGWQIALSIGGDIRGTDVVKLFETAAEMHLLVAQTGGTAEEDLRKYRGDIEAGRLDGIVRASDGVLTFEHFDHGDDKLEDLEMLCEEIGVPFNREISSDDEIDGSLSWYRPDTDQMGECVVDHDGEATLRISDIRKALSEGNLDAFLAQNTPPDLPALKVIDAR